MATSKFAVGAVVLGLALATGAPSHAQQSQSEILARELAQLLTQRQLDSVAAKDPAAPDRFIAALFLPSQLLVVSAQYAAPVLLNERLLKREYKEVYIDLQSASTPDTRIFIDDLGADGLHPRPDGSQPFDSYENGNARHMFNGDWRKQKLSEDEYMKSFGQADASYASMLNLLLAELKKPSS
jgi:hypothetical protein